MMNPKNLLFIKDFVDIDIHPHLRNTNPHWPRKISTRFLNLYKNEMKRNNITAKTKMKPLEIYAVINDMTMIQVEYDSICDEEAMDIITQEVERWDNGYSKDTHISGSISK